MSLVRKPILELYWSKKDIYDAPFIYKNITRDRYSLLLRFLHFNNNDRNDNSSRLFKLQALLDKLTERFRSTYTPGPSVVIDESHSIPRKTYFPAIYSRKNSQIWSQSLQNLRSKCLHLRFKGLHWQHAEDM